MRRKPRVRLEPIMSGGGQERGLRSGTLPAPLIVGLGAACEVCKNIEYLFILTLTVLSSKQCFKKSHLKMYIAVYF